MWDPGGETVAWCSQSRKEKWARWRGPSLQDEGGEHGWRAWGKVQACTRVFPIGKKTDVFDLWMLVLLKPEEMSGFFYFLQMISSIFIKLVSTGKEITWRVLKTFIVQSSFLLENTSLETVLKRVCLFPLADPMSVGGDSALEPEALPTGQPPEWVQFRKSNPGVAWVKMLWIPEVNGELFQDSFFFLLASIIEISLINEQDNSSDSPTQHR